MKVKAIITVELEMTQKDFEITQRAAKEGDMQCFLEMTEIETDGTPTIKLVDEKPRSKAGAINVTTGVVEKV